MSVELAGEELKRREAVWLVLSEFWLDTELDDQDFKRIIEVLRNANYTTSELSGIYTDEVAPVVWMNLFQFWSVTAGVWDGFDPDWLKEKILCNIRRQSKSILYRYWIRGSLFRKMRTLVSNAPWKKCILMLRLE